MSGVTLTYSNMVRIQVGLFADDALRSIFLAQLKIDGDTADVSSKKAIEACAERHLGIAKLFRSLEIVTVGQRAQVNPEIVKSLYSDGLTTLEMLHRILGRCDYRQGLYWFHLTEEVMTPYDIVAKYPARTAGPSPSLIDSMLEQWLHFKLTEAGDRSWTMESWLPCDYGSSYSVRVSKHNGSMHAEVMKEDVLGNFGLGSAAFQTTDAIRTSLVRATTRADEDMTRHLVFSRFVIRHCESKTEQQYLLRLDADAPLPPDYVEGWQEAPAPLSKKHREQAEALIANSGNDPDFIIIGIQS